ncbi:MAG: CpaF family protein [Butyrivibrio sp.]|nr:CpaF family protein [Butyrivibrio sp.]
MVSSVKNLKGAIRQQVVSTIDYSKDISDEGIYEIIDNELVARSKCLILSASEKKRLRKEIFHSIRKLDILQQLLDDPNVTEIMINGTENIFIEKKGIITRFESAFESEEKLEDVVQQIVASCNRVVNESSPIVDARLENGARVNIVLPPVSLCGPVITIRRFPDKPITMDKLIELGAISEELRNYLSILIKSGYNIFISGGTGSGKTTFLNALSDYIPKTKRVITIEDNAELQIQGVQNLVRLEARNANVEGCKEISIRDLIKSSLRMRPDWIIVGEVRGGETVDMLQACNTGHMSMSTGHSNSAYDMLYRLETMSLMGMSELPLQAVRGQICAGIDVIIHLGRYRDNSRKVMEICELEKELDASGRIKLNPLFRFVEEGMIQNEEHEKKIKGNWRKMGELKNIEKLLSAGYKLPD